MNILEAQNFLHLIDFDYKVSDQLLDQQQQACLYAAIEGLFHHPFGKAIIVKHVKTKDIV